MYKSFKIESRKIKGLQITQTRQIKQLEDGFAVQSQNSKKFYFVDQEGLNCTCQDFEERTKTCKHAFAVQYYLQRITTAKKQVKIETKRLTYPQAWSAYNKSQETEKERFLELLADLVKSVEEPEYKFGRPKTSQKDLLFASALKVYTQFSLRRFQSDLKQAKEKRLIDKTPCFASVGHFMQKKQLTPILQHLISLSASDLKSVETKFAIDSSGFRTTSFNEYCQEKHGKSKSHKWLKAHVVSGTKTNIITSANISKQDGLGSGDSPHLKPLLKRTRETGFEIKEFSGDKAYSSRDNLELIDQHGGVPFIPFKSQATGKSKANPIWKKMYHYFCLNQEEFNKHYHLRSNSETVFHMIKTKFNDLLKSKSHTAQVNELLLKILCHNIVVVIHETNELGISADFNDI